jgi:glycosyltransferase involved in cell wall biosynthesis
LNRAAESGADLTAALHSGEPAGSRSATPPGLRVAINAISTIHGGAAVALEKLLTQFVILRPQHEFHVIANTTLLESARIRHPNVKFHHFAWAQRSYLRTSLWYMTALPLWLKHHRIDVLFSQTCYLPPLRPRRSAMLLQDARYFSEVPRLDSILTQRELIYFGLKQRWVNYSVRHADDVIVQSQVMAGMVAKKLPEAAPRLRVVHHGPGFLDGNTARVRQNNHVRGNLEIAYVSLYRPYKNFAVLFRALQLLKTRGINARLHLTLDTGDPDAQAVLRNIAEFCAPEQVVNHGVIDHCGVARLYDQVHVVVFPSLCESFGFPQIEAMALGLPVIASDTPINREVCGSVASYFSPDDERALADALERFCREPDELTRVSNLSIHRAGNFKWSTAARETLQCLEHGLSEN